MNHAIERTIVSMRFRGKSVKTEGLLRCVSEKLSKIGNLTYGNVAFQPLSSESTKNNKGGAQMDALSLSEPLRGQDVGYEGQGGLSYWSARLLTDRAEAAAWSQQVAATRRIAAANDKYTDDSDPDFSV
ncbi:hypothetical protein [Crenobacter luteus]|uniref:hypothetical protein n=1 Tax=Crenobacter luteus TaxID=1452487 RepID=UPI00104B57F7|nr:hypothetical protein [Crenobacter luteus]